MGRSYLEARRQKDVLKKASCDLFSSALFSARPPSRCVEAPRPPKTPFSGSGKFRERPFSGTFSLGRDPQHWLPESPTTTPIRGLPTSPLGFRHGFRRRTPARFPMPDSGTISDAITNAGAKSPVTVNDGRQVWISKTDANSITDTDSNAPTAGASTHQPIPGWLLSLSSWISPSSPKVDCCVSVQGRRILIPARCSWICYPIINACPLLARAGLVLVSDSVSEQLLRVATCTACT